MKAFEVSVNLGGDERFTQTVYAETAGKAKYKRLLDIHDAGWEDVSFRHLKCRFIGDIPTPHELLQRQRAAFNEKHPIGTMVRYWSGLKEGEPTGVGRIKHEATVVSQHISAWIDGARSCISITHVEADLKIHELEHHKFETAVSWEKLANLRKDT